VTYSRQYTHWKRRFTGCPVRLTTGPRRHHLRHQAERGWAVTPLRQATALAHRDHRVSSGLRPRTVLSRVCNRRPPVAGMATHRGGAGSAGDLRAAALSRRTDEHSYVVHARWDSGFVLLVEGTWCPTSSDTF